MEKIVEQAAREHGDRLRCAIICSCGVYGKGRGPGNTESGLVPMYWAQIAKSKRAFYTSSGANTRSWVHIDDLCKVYLALVESAVAGGGRADWGREVRFFNSFFLLQHPCALTRGGAATDIFLPPCMIGVLLYSDAGVVAAGACRCDWEHPQEAWAH